MSNEQFTQTLLYDWRTRLFLKKPHSPHKMQVKRREEK